MKTKQRRTLKHIHISLTAKGRGKLKDLIFQFGLNKKRGISYAALKGFAIVCKLKIYSYSQQLVEN